MWRSTRDRGCDGLRDGRCTLSLSALIRSMSAAGAPAEAIALAVEAIEGAEAKLTAQREAARDRKRKQRAGQSRDGHGTVTGRSGDSHDAAPLSRPLSPQTPLSPTHSPPDITTRARGGNSRPVGFDQFWAVYPNKVKKPVAERAYAKALGKISGHDPPSVLLAGVERAKASREWLDGFIPHPSSWLNGERWTDQPAEIIPITGPRHERPHQDAKLAVRHANYAASWEGSERAAGRDWKP